MANEKTTGQKRKRAATGRGDGEGMALRSCGDPRSERRYEPKATSTGVIAMIGAAIGAGLAGAGTYGQWFRAEALGPHKFAAYLLAAGALVLIAVALFGTRVAKPLRVGDAGIGLEDDHQAELDRMEWRDITGFLLATDALTVHGNGTSLVVPLDIHAQGVARIVAEAKTRLPKLAEGLDSTVLEALDDTKGEVLSIEPPQVAGERCRKTDKIIAFEKDARLCARCGEIYHQDSAPQRCLTCDAKLTPERS